MALFLKSRAARRETLTFYLLISPWIVGFLFFTLGPVLVSLGISFTRWNLLTPPVPIGLRNYTRMLDDRLFWQSLSVTFRYTLLYVPSELVGGLLLALLMNRNIKGIRADRTSYYLPTVISGVAFVVVWMWLFQPEVGLINATLSRFGIQGPRWLADPRTALFALWMMSLWGLGRNAIIFLAGLKGIPKELYEAAAMDGAGMWQGFRHVTLPMLTPTIFFVLVLSLIATLQTFTSAFVATNGGPLDSTLFYVLYLYRKAFQEFQMGYAAALAWVLFIVILLLTILVVRSGQWWVYYEGERES
ncbi:MAG: sugar ABC transporter permease [Anaerolineales bacterium]|nr:sugar ABC transporter permease [Anaerolineales bacterium]